MIELLGLLMPTSNEKKLVGCFKVFIFYFDLYFYFLVLPMWEGFMKFEVEVGDLRKIAHALYVVFHLCT